MAMLKIIGDYKIDKKKRLGKGTFGSVFKGVDQKSNFDVAAKVLDLGTHADLEESVPFAMKEVRAMKSVPAHPHVLQILYHKITHDYDNDIHQLWLVMKYCNSGSLNDYFCTHQPNDEEILKFLLQTADAVAFLHSHGVVHNDLKPSNILLTREILKPLVKIADFGLSDATNRDYMSVKGGSYHYMAPELFVADASPTHTRKSDAFALGVIIKHLLQTVHGKVLECREVRGDRYLGKVMYENLLKGEQIEDPVQVLSTDSEIQRELKVLAVDMMRPQHRDRPEMEQVHSRLKGVAGERQHKERNEDPENNGSYLKKEREKQEKLLDSLSPFLKACYEGKTIEVMKQLDSDKSLLTETDNSGNSCLYWALSSGNVELFTRLVERGADVKHVNEEGENLLFTACSLQMKTFYSILMEKYHLDGSAKRKDELDCLCAAACNGDIDAFNCILLLGVPSHSRVIFKAASYGQLSFIRYLLEETRLEVDIEAQGRVTRQTAAAKAARKGRLEMLKYLVSKGADLFTKDIDERTCLHLSSQSGHLEVSNFLIAQGLDIHAIDKWQRTPIHYAAWKGHLQVAEMLVTKGADLFTKDINENTCLHLSSEKGHLETSNFLIAQGLDIHATDKWQRTPIHYAAWKGHLQVAEMLMAKGADLFTGDIDERTCLHHSSEKGHLETSNFLIAQGLDIHATDKWQRTAIHYAAWNGHLQVAEMLVAKGADLFTRDEDEDTCLHFSSRNGHLEMSTFLIAKGLDIHAKNKWNRAALHYAEQNGHLQVAEMLAAQARRDLMSQLVERFKHMFGKRSN